MATGSEVLYERSGHVATITINRPERRNAVNGDVVTAMTAGLQEFEADTDVWVGIVTGAGEAAFCAGADLQALSQGGSIWSEQGGFAGFVRYPTTKPIIAAVNGLALGGGFEIALACDLVVAAEHAAFALPEVSRGIVAAGGGLFRLPRRIPPALAAELILTGERLFRGPRCCSRAGERGGPGRATEGDRPAPGRADLQERAPGHSRERGHHAPGVDARGRSCLATQRRRPRARAGVR